MRARLDQEKDKLHCSIQEISDLKLNSMDEKVKIREE